MLRFPRLTRPCLLGTTLAAAAMTLPAGSAHGADPVFGPPVTVALGAAETTVVSGPAGDLALAWAGRDGGVFVTRRAVGALLPGPPELLTSEVGGNLQLRRNARGDLALTWNGAGSRSAPARPRLSVAAAGERFSDPASPPDAGAGTAVIEPWRRLDDPPTSSTLGIDGRGVATLAYPGTDGVGLIADRLPGDAGFEAARRVSAGGWGAPRVAAGEAGTTVAWTAPTPGAIDGMESVYVLERPAGGDFGTPRIVSAPGSDASPGLTQMSVGVGPRNEAIVTWGSSPPPENGIFHPFPSGSDVAERDASGRWSAPKPLVPSGGPFGAGGNIAFNDVGDAVVSVGMDLTFRPAGVAFGPARKDFIPYTSGLSAGRVAIDALGITVKVGTVSASRITTRAGRLQAIVRERGAGLSQTFDVSRPGEQADAPAVATDAAGRGVVVWVDHALGALRLAPYVAAAPALTGLALTDRAFVFRSSRAALLDISVRGRRGGGVIKTVTQRAFARASANTVAFEPRLRKFLTRKGRYTVQIRSRDKGPRAGTMTLRVTRPGASVKKKAKRKKRPAKTTRR